MNANLAKELCRVGDLTMHEEYRGRGMSRETVAVSGPVQEFLGAIADLFTEKVEEALAAREDEVERDRIEEDLEELALESIRDLQMDNLGRDFVFY